MEAQTLEDALLIVTSATLTVLSLLFILLSLAGQVLTKDDDRTRLGTALGHVSGSLGVMVTALAGLFIMRVRAGPDGLLKPDWLNGSLRIVLVGSAVWCLVAGLVALPQLIRRFRAHASEDIYEINQAAVFGTLAKALPIIVSNHEGTIQHTTTELDALVGAVPGDLIGKSLEVIMPERYRAGHHHGMTRYMETREPHIIGTVVAIDMLRRDGVEIPVYLALNTTDVDGKPWYVASLWPRPRVEPETLVSTFSDDVAGTIDSTAGDVAEMKIDVKTLRQHAGAADVRADAADVRADAAEARADAAETDRHGPP